MTTFQKMQQFLARRFGLRESEIVPDRSLQSLGIDSLAAIELLFDIEDEFGIRVPEDQRDIETLRDLAALIDGQLALKCAEHA
ncbi:MAG: hypothetical protein A3G25_15825 [Betaproteobacteria bacterium RIFCSPLOWO2_12_FULL_63_13]|nr:MAG: hypothetical protein A3H32_12600 [Betaproteobacteria bacterium RIFCSPLOWO2_02_FULL_63_19]OGA42949.1 MAG: hypothetical protein A3G25_15825 [Betaproteobacteria bacterium RIFCSPLOWO2_12_FULL_63_13]